MVESFEGVTFRKISRVNLKSINMAVRKLASKLKLKTAMPGQPGQLRTASTGQPRKDSRNRTAGTGQLR